MVCILTSPLTHKHNCVDCSLTTVNQPLLFHHVGSTDFISTSLFLGFVHTFLPFFCLPYGLFHTLPICGWLLCLKGDQVNLFYTSVFWLPLWISLHMSCFRSRNFHSPYPNNYHLHPEKCQIRQFLVITIFFFHLL